MDGGSEPPEKLDHLVDQRLQAFLRGRVAPHSVDALCSDLEHEPKAGLAFSATATCALVGELLLGSTEGGIFPNQHAFERLVAHGSRRAQRDWLAVISCLRALRNACFHPASVTRQREGELLIEDLADRLRRRGERFADMLERDYSALRSEGMTVIAVRLLDELGIEILERS